MVLTIGGLSFRVKQYNAGLAGWTLCYNLPVHLISRRQRSDFSSGAFERLLPRWQVVTPGSVEVERVQYLNQPNCYRLSNGTVEVIVTTDVGPRVVRYGFVGSENILGEIPDLKIVTELGEWRAWGGHRLWTAPEDLPRSYSPDNSPLEFKISGDNAVWLLQPVEPKTGIQKEMTVTLSPEGSEVTVHHRITNRHPGRVELAPWAVTIMQAGGMTILPQEPYRSHDDYLLPARPLVLWHYTDLSDPRWTMGKKFIRLCSDSSMETSQKIGIANKQGWAAYWKNRTLFVKRVAYNEGASYPDYGSNVETYTAGSFIELETLGPLQSLQQGESVEHVETWSLYSDVDIGATEASLEAALAGVRR